MYIFNAIEARVLLFMLITTVFFLFFVFGDYTREELGYSLFPKMGECREVLGGGPAHPSKL